MVLFWEGEAIKKKGRILVKGGRGDIVLSVGKRIWCDVVWFKKYFNICKQ